MATKSGPGGPLLVAIIGPPVHFWSGVIMNIVPPPQSCPPGTLFTSEYCPPGHYSLVNNVPLGQYSLAPLVNNVPHKLLC